ncbi:MAG: hypothetical protein ACP5OA_00055 [Candidatus Woesearchaeota archaeon]
MDEPNYNINGYYIHNEQVVRLTGKAQISDSEYIKTKGAYLELKIFDTFKKKEYFFEGMIANLNDEIAIDVMEFQEKGTPTNIPRAALYLTKSHANKIPGTYIGARYEDLTIENILGDIFQDTTPMTSENIRKIVDNTIVKTKKGATYVQIELKHL